MYQIHHSIISYLGLIKSILLDINHFILPEATKKGLERCYYTSP